MAPPYLLWRSVNGGVKAGHRAEQNQAGLRRGRRARCATSAPAEMARVSQPGRTWLSGGADYFAGFGIGGYGFLIGRLGHFRALV